MSCVFASDPVSDPRCFPAVLSRMEVRRSCCAIGGLPYPPQVRTRWTGVTHHSLLPRLTCPLLNPAFICVPATPSHSRLRCSKASLPVLLPSSVLLCLRSILQSELTRVYFITSSSSELVVHFNLFCLPQSLLSSASLYIEVSCRGCFFWGFFHSHGWVVTSEVLCNFFPALFYRCVRIICLDRKKYEWVHSWNGHFSIQWGPKMKTDTREAGREGYRQSKWQCGSFLHPCRVSLQLQSTCMSDTVMSTTDRMKQARLFQCKPLWKRRRSS